MALVRLSLRRPYTAAIAAFIIMLGGAMSLTRMIVDIFPIINSPVVLVTWNYGGLPAEEMERRVVLVGVPFAFNLALLPSDNVTGITVAHFVDF